MKSSKISSDKQPYDERQLAVRGLAYKAAFITLALYNVGYGLVWEVKGIWTATAAWGLFAGVCIAFSVFAIVCIAKDAYLALTEKPGRYLAFAGAVALCNLSVGFAGILNPSVVYHRFSQYNLLLGITFTLIEIVFTCKVLFDRRADKQEQSNQHEKP